MSSKKQSPLQRLVAFAITVTEEELDNVVEVITAIRNSRFPRTQAKPKTPRKPRADKGVQRGLPKGTPKPTVGLMDVSNGGDTDDAG